MTFLGLKMIIFGHFSRFLASFKISFSSLQHPNYNREVRVKNSCNPPRVQVITMSSLAVQIAFAFEVVKHLKHVKDGLNRALVEKKREKDKILT